MKLKEKPLDELRAIQNLLREIRKATKQKSDMIMEAKLQSHLIYILDNEEDSFFFSVGFTNEFAKSGIFQY